MPPKKNTKYQLYNVYEDVFFPNRSMDLQKSLDPGLYNINETMQGELYFQSFEPKTDKLIALTDNESQVILKEIDYFWKDETKAKYDKYGVIYKRGILMYGAPGTGKTATIMQTANAMIAQGAVILYDKSPRLIARGLQAIHAIEPNKKVIVVLEECDEYVNSSQFLSLLDGETSTSNVFYIATTNYIDRIPNRIKNRPSRFATVIELKAPTEAARRAYLSTKLDDVNTVEEYVQVTEGFVIDNIKDLIISTMIYDVTLKDAVSKVKSYSKIESDNKSEEDQEYSDDMKSAAIRLLESIGNEETQEIETEYNGN